MRKITLDRSFYKAFSLIVLFSLLTINLSANKTSEVHAQVAFSATNTPEMGNSFLEATPSTILVQYSATFEEAIDASLAKFERNLNRPFTPSIAASMVSNEYGYAKILPNEQNISPEDKEEFDLLVLAKNTPNGWYALAPGTVPNEAYNDLLLSFPDSMLDEFDKSYHYQYNASEAVSLAASGHKLPWQNGNTAILMRHGGTGHELQLDFDIAAQTGTWHSNSGYVYASKPGTVIYVKEVSPNPTGPECVDWQRANAVVIKHSDNEYSWYFHLAQNSVDVNEGDSVSYGTRIAQEGRTGCTYGATGIHLHFHVSTSVSITSTYPSRTDPNVAPWPPAGSITTVDFQEVTWNNLVDGTHYTSQNAGGTVPFGYEQCSSESGRCDFSGTAYIIYGANGSYTSERQFTNGVDCNNNVFGDPIPGSSKYCYQKGGGPAGYTYCVNEGGSCSFNGIATVAYGASRQYNYQSNITGGIACNNDVFGDPYPGLGKACYYQITSSGDNVTLYTAASYGGTKYGWHDPGSYNLPDYMSDQSASIQIAGGWSARLFEHSNEGGGEKCFNSSDSDFNGDTYDTGGSVYRSASSIIVYNQENCPNLDAVMVYERNNLEGQKQTWISAGSYNLNGTLDNISSSIRIQQGWSARVFQDPNKSGGQFCFDSTDTDFADNTFYTGAPVNEAVSSIEVYQQETCPSNPTPTISSISPTSAIAGGATFTLTVNGTNFISASKVRWNGSDRTTTYVSDTQLTASIPASDIASVGTAYVTVFNPAPGGGTSGQLPFTISKISTTTTITGDSPDPSLVNQSYTVSATVSAASGTPAGTVNVSDGSTSCNISLSSGSGSCSLTSTSSGVKTLTANYSGTSNYSASSGTASHTVNNPVPTVSSINPASTTVGGASFTLTVNGTNFVSSSKVRWNGVDHITDVVSSTQLTAYVSASDITSAGIAYVTVFNPAPGGGTSGPLPFTVNSPVCPTITQWQGEYWNNIDLSGQRALCRNDFSLNFDWGMGTPDPLIPGDQFSASWTRTVNFSSGTYIFNMSHDDGAKLYIDNMDNPVLDKWATCCAVDHSANIPISAGNHVIKMKYVENGGAANAALWWEPTVINGWRGEYYNNEDLSGYPAIVRDDPSINFDWLGNAPDPMVTSDHFSVRWTRSVNFTAGTYTFSIVHDDGARLYIDNSLIYENWCASNCYVATTVDKYLSAGSHSIKMEMKEIGGYASAKLSWQVKKLDTTTTITGDSPDPSLVNQSYTVSVTVSAASGTPTGTVTVSDGSVSCNITLSSGSGSCPLASTTGGTKTLTASYAGNTTYNPSSGTSSHTVNNNPVPTISSISPTSATAGGATFTLTVNGTNFLATSKINWNGSDRTTTYLSSTQLTASIPASDIAIAGTAYVSVFNPAPGGGNSSSLSFIIDPPASGAPGPFSKISPPVGVLPQPASLTLTWETSSNAISYEYCYDTTNDNTCLAGWINNGLSTTKTISGLKPATVYYWQVRAINALGTTRSNNGTWWSFTTGNLPGAFGKSSPANGAANQQLDLSLTWNSSNAVGYEYCFDTSNNNACDGSWINTGAGTNASISGLSLATTYYWQVRAINDFGATRANAGTWWSFITHAPVLLTVNVRSVGTNDGWILESSEISGLGGTQNSVATILRLGDDAANKQYRAILSFDTSAIPDGASITSVTLKFKYAGVSGTNPFTTHGNILADVYNGAFNDNVALELGDFNNAASKAKVLIYINNAVNYWYSNSFNPADFLNINPNGVTQFRLRFSKDDNNDFGADFLKIFSGDALVETDRPQLIIKYYVP